MLSEPVFYNKDQTRYYKFVDNLINFNIDKVFYRSEGLEFLVQAGKPFFAMMFVNDTSNERHKYTIRVSQIISKIIFNSNFMLKVTGNAGADQSGIYSEISGTIHLGSLNADYNVFQISEAGEDAVICEVYFVVYDREVRRY